MKRKLLFALLFTFILLFLGVTINFGQAPTSSDKSVKIWEEPISIPTYLVDPPNVKPDGLKIALPRSLKI